MSQANGWDREEELWGYLGALQAQIDRLMETDEARLGRIRKLEEDRQVLLDRLRSAQEQIRRRKLFRGDPPRTPRLRLFPMSRLTRPTQILVCMYRASE